jgi:hypothetical protein
VSKEKLSSSFRCRLPSAIKPINSFPVTAFAASEGIFEIHQKKKNIMTTYHDDHPCDHSAGIAGRAQAAKATISDPRLQRLSDLLREARPRLIACVEQLADNTLQTAPCIRDDEPLVTEVINEGFNPTNSPIGYPVYWRIIDRADGCSITVPAKSRESRCIGYGAKPGFDTAILAPA